jgi:hypothetical protein
MTLCGKDIKRLPPRYTCRGVFIVKSIGRQILGGDWQPPPDGGGGGRALLRLGFSAGETAHFCQEINPSRLATFSSSYQPHPKEMVK